MPWLGLLLYVIVFFAFMHLIDRLASRGDE